MIEVAAVLSDVVGHWAEFGIICVLLLSNAMIEFWQEQRRAERDEAKSKAGEQEPLCRPYVAISRQEGSLGGSIAKGVAEALGWDLFGKELIEQRRSGDEITDEQIRALTDLRDRLLDVNRSIVELISEM